MNEKHIQGPWSVEGTDNAGQFHVCAGGNLIAVTAHEGVMPDDIQRANADLIAAAPDLLEALKNIENDDGSIPDTIWALRNAAIAKAEGKES